ncbi:MAG TPA: cytochrome P450 [Baekduia sp.]
MSAEHNRGIDPHDPAFVDDPHPTYDDLRSGCPAHRSDHHGGFWLLTRYADVRAAAVDWKTYTSAVPGVTAIPMVHQRDTAQIPIELDPPEHSRYRHLIQPAFRRDRVAALRPDLEERLVGLWARLLAQESGDLVADVVVPFSLATLGRFLGLPQQDTVLWLGWVRRMFSSTTDRADAVAASDELGAYIDDLVAAREAHPGDDFFSHLLAARLDGRGLTRDEIRAMGVVMLIAGHETSANAMSYALVELLRDPSLLQRLRDDAGLVDTAVEEMLRVSSPIQMFGRNATRDVELHGQVIGQGDVVALGFGAANHDPEVFDDPQSCRLDRTPNRHLTFGMGHHLCIGAPVARLELAVLLEQAPDALRRVHLDHRRPPRWKDRGDQRGWSVVPVNIRGTA